MIQSTDKVITKNKNAVFYASTSESDKIVGNTVMRGSSNSTTISRKPITEIPTGILPEDADIETARSVIAGMVLEGDLTEDEITALLDVYQKWDDLPLGEWISELDENDNEVLLVYADTLYKVVQGHNKQADWTPDITAALYTRAVPDTVIPVWVQPTGAHDAYAVDALVQWPEGGTVWRSTIPANTTEPGTLLPWGYWVEAE